MRVAFFSEPISSLFEDMARQAIFDSGHQPDPLFPMASAKNRRPGAVRLEHALSDMGWLARADLLVVLFAASDYSAIGRALVSLLAKRSEVPYPWKPPVIVYIEDRFPRTPERYRNEQSWLQGLSIAWAVRIVRTPEEVRHLLSRDLVDFADGHSPHDPSTSIVLPRVSPLHYRTLVEHPERLQGCSSRLLEELIAQLLEMDGWEVNLISRTNAPGPDIIAVSSKLAKDIPLQLVVECKQYNPDRPVDIDVVRKIMYWVNEDYQASLGMIATTSHFTRDAQEQAERLHHWRLDLRDQQKILDWIDRTSLKAPH